MNRKLNLLLLFVLPFLCSCSYLLSRTSKVSLTKQNKNDEIKVVNKANGKKVDVNNFGSFEFENTTNNYVANVSRKGYRSKNQIISHKNFNKWKVADLLLTSVATTLMVTTKASDPLWRYYFFGASAGFTGVIVGPWKVYGNNYTLPELTPLPQKKADHGFISAIDYKLSIPQEDRKIFSYKDLSHYSKGSFKTQNLDNNSIIIDKYTIDQKDAYAILHNFGYIDTTRVLKQISFEDLKLNIEIINLVEHKISNNKKIEIGSKISLYNFTSQEPIITKEINAESNWIKFYSFEAPINDALKLDVLESAVSQFLEQEDVISSIAKYKLKPVKEEYDLAITKISSDTGNVNSIKNGVKAVVTVITNEGHGSGCGISSDGYILTNAHVISNSDSSLNVQLADLSIHKAKLVSINPIKDLALLKIDTVLAFYFGLNKQPKIEIGDEAYTIGAYNIGDYSIGIAKGIISSKRKLDGIDFIQTDATINSGNSGGAFINSKGELLGVITAKMVGKGVEGIGFVIPNDQILGSLNIELE